MTAYEGPSAAEQLDITRNLLAYDSQDIIINRPPVKERQSDGSMKRPSGSDEVLASQKLFFSGIRSDDIRKFTVNGKEIVSTFILVGLPDADFQEDDWFMLWDRKWIVGALHEDRRWQRKGWCYSIGG